RRARRGAIFAGVCLAVVLTPPDPFSWSLMAVPMILLYELGILVCQLLSRSEKNAESPALRTCRLARLDGERTANPAAQPARGIARPPCGKAGDAVSSSPSPAGAEGLEASFSALSLRDLQFLRAPAERLER